MWNYEFALAALFIQAVLIFFYAVRRRLPLRHNGLFMWLLVTETLATAMNIMASLALTSQKLSITEIYLLNIAYYILYGVSCAAFYFYVLSLPRREYKRTWLFDMAGKAFLTVYVLIVLFTPLTGILFEIPSPGQFHAGRFYIGLEFMFFTYVAMSVVYMLICRNLIDRTQFFGIFTCIAILVIGDRLKPVFSNHMIFDFAAAIALFIIFQTMQNPEYFYDRRANVFSVRGFRSMMKEIIQNHRSHDCLYIAIQNHNKLKTMYSERQIVKMLRHIGSKLRSEFKGHYVFYLSQGRFVVLLSEPVPHMLLVKRALKVFEQPCPVDQQTVTLTKAYVTLAADFHPSSAEQFEGCLNTALAEACRRGDGGSEILDGKMEKRTRRRQEVIRALEKALANDGFEVFYQPIYSNADGAHIAAEALARLIDDTIGYIPPDEFIPIAEQEGLIDVLGRQIMTKVCAFIKAHPLKTLGLHYIEINLSPLQCGNKNLADDFLAIMQEYGVSPEEINLEITETAATGSNSVVGEQMHKFTKEGVSFSLDDYGTGYSNFSSIFGMPIDIVKIDKSLVWAYFDDSNRILPSIISIMRNMKKKVLCEGAETAEMIKGLKEMGCDFVQGYYYSKPLREDDFVDYLQNAAAQK